MWRWVWPLGPERFLTEHVWWLFFLGEVNFGCGSDSLSGVCLSSLIYTLAVFNFDNYYQALFFLEKVNNPVVADS